MLSFTSMLSHHLHSAFVTNHSNRLQRESQETRLIHEMKMSLFLSHTMHQYKLSLLTQKIGSVTGLSAEIVDEQI